MYHHSSSGGFPSIGEMAGKSSVTVLDLFIGKPRHGYGYLLSIQGLSVSALGDPRILPPSPQPIYIPGAPLACVYEPARHSEK